MTCASSASASPRLLLGLGLLAVALVIGLGAVLWQRHEGRSERSQLLTPSPEPTGIQQTMQPVPVDGARAYTYLRQQTRLGPRPTGTAAIERLRILLERHFRAQGLDVQRQRFLVRHPVQGRPVQAANIVARYRPQARRRILLGAHYDTRPLADEDPRPRPYLGANDGASGVALLMELAHHLGKLQGEVGVDLVCFDAEELVYGPSAGTQRGEYCLGSKHFARLFRAGRRDRPYYEAAVILDMVGGKDAAFYPERYSVERAGWLVEEIWRVAEGLGVEHFRRPAFGRRWRYEVYDDHVPLQESGIPAIDIIDFDYEHWHRNSDRPQNCSPKTLQAVGTVVLTWLTQRSASR